MKNEHGLTQPQERFATLVAEGLPGCDAYLQAYPKSKTWKEQSRRVNAAQLLADTNIAQRMQALQAAAAERSILKIEEVLEETRRLMLATPASLIDKETGKIKLPHELDPATAAAVASFEIDDLGRVKYKFWDKNAALERAAKILGAFERDNAQKQQVNVVKVELVALQPVAPAVVIEAEDDGGDE